MIIPETVISTCRDFLRAKTPEEIYALPFPLVIAPLQHPDKFQEFYSPIGRGTVTFELNKSTAVPANDPLSGPKIIIAQHFSAIKEDWHAACFAIMSARCLHDDPMHVDMAVGNPKLIDCVATHTPTMCVAHGRTLEILRSFRSLNHVLTADLTTERGNRIFLEFRKNIDLSRKDPQHLKNTGLGDYVEFTHLMEDALKSMPLNTANCMTSLTFHKQGTPLHPKRVFFHAMNGYEI